MRIPILIPELDRDLILGEGEQLLAEGVVLLFLPFLGQEVLDGGSSGKERGPISPDAVGGVGLGNHFWVSARVRRSRATGLGMRTGRSRGLVPFSLLHVQFPE